MNAEQQIAAIRAVLDGPGGLRARARANSVGAPSVVRAIDNILGPNDDRETATLRARYGTRVGPCPCDCNSGGFCGGCGHAGCSGGINVR